MISRFFINISYRGTKYNGWQIQSNGTTVQGIIQEKLSLLLREPVSLTGAGRTDTGVHALKYIAHFDSDKPDINNLDNLVYHLNSILPEDIAVNSIFQVNPSAHARFSAVSRSYIYYIHFKKDPFLKGQSFLFHQKLDLYKMQEACKILMGYSDFKSFSKNHTDVKTYYCKIYEANWQKSDRQVIFRITADRFLRNMVRAIVGTMLQVGRGNISLEGFKDIILSRERSLAGQSVPAEGLFLTDIKYPEEIFLFN